MANTFFTMMCNLLFSKCSLLVGRTGNKFDLLLFIKKLLHHVR